MRYLVHLSRIIVGVLFIISGFVKAVDPIGLSFKLEEYFSPGVLNIPFLMDLSLPLATFFSIFEIVLGVLLLLGLFRKFTTYALLATIVFFTFLTFYSAYFNKVTDCGCFGDALKLEPWTSFYKDVVLIVLILILVVGNRYIQPLFIKPLNIALVSLVTIGSIIISYIGINHLPMIDFRAYAVGKDLVHGMKSAEELGLKPTKYKTLFTLKNKLDGSTIVVDDKKYISQKLYQDISIWEMDVDKTKNVIDQKGYEAPIHDFYFDCNGVDKTSFYLSHPKVILIVVPFAEKISTEQTNKINNLAKEAKSKGYEFVTVSNNPINKLESELCFMDQTTMKTIIRSNPGIVLISNGVVKAKYHDNDFPTVQQLDKKL
ncbi:MAG: DoxX family membrane protein [Weeksellaceae bacterium]|nr:DoxX family membrane protein [Weeksellaceae bacterium]